MHRDIIMYKVSGELCLGLEAEAQMGGKHCSRWRWDSRLRSVQGQPAEEVALDSVGTGKP